MIGFNNKIDMIYLIDFGLCNYYRKKNGEHIEFKSNAGHVGNIRFSSINALQGHEQSRRDDLESLAYILIYLMKGNLPWCHIKCATEDKPYRTLEKKISMTGESICQNLPIEFLKFFNYVRGLSFYENPNYKFMKNLFRQLMKKNKFGYDYMYDWMEEIYEPYA